MSSMARLRPRPALRPTPRHITGKRRQAHNCHCPRSRIRGREDEDQCHGREGRRDHPGPRDGQGREVDDDRQGDQDEDDPYRSTRPPGIWIVFSSSFRAVARGSAPAEPPGEGCLATSVSSPVPGRLPGPSEYWDASRTAPGPPRREGEGMAQSTEEECGRRCARWVWRRAGPIHTGSRSRASEKSAAHRLGLSHSTVKHHLANARSQVGVAATAQLVWIHDERLPEPCVPSWELEQRRRSGSRASAVGFGSVHRDGGHPQRAAPTARPVRGRDMADVKTSTKRTSSAKASGDVFSEEERSAMQATIRERKKAAKLTPEEARAAGEADVRAAIAGLPEEDRAMATRVHEIVLEAAPELMPRTFYGMPAYARDGKVVCFFQAKAKFKVRYSTLGFQHDARLDEGEMWPVAFALTGLTAAGERRISELVKKAAG